MWFMYLIQHRLFSIPKYYKADFQFYFLALCMQVQT